MFAFDPRRTLSAAAITEVERVVLGPHRRLILAMRRVTSAGVSLSALDLSASALRAAGRSRQRESQALRFGIAERSMSTARLMTAATLRSATVKSLPSRYFCSATAPSRTSKGAAKTLRASLRLMASRSAAGRRMACSDQMLTPRSTSVTAHKLHCQAPASPFFFKGSATTEMCSLSLHDVLPSEAKVLSTARTAYA